jgi:hypothetical protein
MNTPMDQSKHRLPDSNAESSFMNQDQVLKYLPGMGSALRKALDGQRIHTKTHSLRKLRGCY